MPRKPSHLLLLAALPLLSPNTNTVNAFGGFFGRTPPDQPVTSTNDAILYGLQGNAVTLQIQLDYQGAKEESTPAAGGLGGFLFKQWLPPELEEAAAAQEEEKEDERIGWILPVPSVPTKVDVGNAILMDALFHHTRPHFVLNIFNETSNQASKQHGSVASTTCTKEGLVDGCEYTNEGPFRGNNGLANVLEEGRAGIYEYTVLKGDDAQGVLTWLQEHNFTHEEEVLLPQLEAYASQGHSFVAVQLTADEPSGDLQQPLLVQYELPQTDRPAIYSVPLFLSHGEELNLQVYFLSDQPNGRAVPVNYIDVVMDDVYVDWVGCMDAMGGDEACYWKDYETRFQAVVETLADHSLVTEYAGPASRLAEKLGVDLDAVTGLDQTTTWLEVVQLLQEAGVPAIDPLQQVLLEYIPLNFLFHPLGCEYWTKLYHPNAEEMGEPSHEECYELWYAPADWEWDPVGLAQALKEQVFLPAQEAQQWVDQFQWLTRFLGYIPDVENLQKEPHFVISDEAPLVSNHHRATAVPVCAYGDGKNPSSLEITLMPREKQDAANDVVTFYQPAFLKCGWRKSERFILWDLNQVSQLPWSYAEKFIAHGVANGGRPAAGQGLVVAKDESMGVLFDPDALEQAIAYGDELLANLTAAISQGSEEALVSATTKNGPPKNPDLDSASNVVDEKDTVEKFVEEELETLEHDLSLRGSSSAALRGISSLIVLAGSTLLVWMS